LSDVPQALQCTASTSCRCNPQLGQVKRTLWGLKLEFHGSSVTSDAIAAVLDHRLAC
jgi:hypothetical protein